MKGKSSKYRGVTWNQKSLKWQANITIKGKTTSVGLFANERLAALAYDKAVIKAGSPEKTNILKKHEKLDNKKLSPVISS